MEINFPRTDIEIIAILKPVNPAFVLIPQKPELVEYDLTQGELISIFLAQKTLAMYQGTPYYDQLKAAFDKMSAILPD